MSNKIQTGANTLCFLNGQQTGVVTAINYRELSNHLPEFGLDSPEAFELSPTTVMIQGQIQVLMLRDDEALEKRGVTDGLPHIATEPYFTLEIQNRLSGFSIMKVERAKIDDQSWNVSAKGFYVGSFTFKGLMVKNHSNQ